MLVSNLKQESLSSSVLNKTTAPKPKSRAKGGEVEYRLLYNFQNQIIWTKLKITSFRFVLYNLEWRLAAVESVVPPLLYSAYYVPSHMLQKRPRPCTNNSTFHTCSCQQYLVTLLKPMHELQCQLLTDRVITCSEANWKFTVQSNYLNYYIYILLVTYSYIPTCILKLMLWHFSWHDNL